jgi:hypothetical protein
MQLSSKTKALIQKLRNEDYDNLLEKVVSFSLQFEIYIPDLSARYGKGKGLGYYQRDHIRVEHHYRFDIFNATINFQFQELDNMFGEGVVELLTLRSVLDPKGAINSLALMIYVVLRKSTIILIFLNMIKLI